MSSRVHNAINVYSEIKRDFLLSLLQNNYDFIKNDNEKYEALFLFQNQEFLTSIKFEGIFKKYAVLYCIPKKEKEILNILIDDENYDVFLNEYKMIKNNVSSLISHSGNNFVNNKFYLRYNKFIDNELNKR
ncbi:hypothetical protein [Spiroplasma endosymbiont of Labia minor]|uniref:hypothetical protein n=1 Tax=Spiroplasma endosymbiont of Labia minor TaxID=3066305 RepID=UPI0030CD949D